MPLTKSAKKKLRQDKKRLKQNRSKKDYLKETLKKARSNPSIENVRVAVKATDKAAKKQIIHKNKAARIKSSLSKLIAGKEDKTHTNSTQRRKTTKKSTK